MPTMRSISRLIRSRSAAAGAVLYVAMRWFDRVLGVVSTIVLARLLTPDDFGIVALALIVLGLATVMLDLGINVLVVQRQALSRADIDTAWTLRLLQSVCVASVLLLSARFVSEYYGDPRLKPVMAVLALTYLLDGLTSMGPILFQRRQEYAREVSFFIIKRVAAFVVTILLAVWWRNYWALLVGMVLGAVVGVFVSYVMYGVAPRLTLVSWRHFLGGSFWLTLRGIGSYAVQQLDKLAVGQRDGTAILGIYSMADQISAMPTNEVIAPMGRALFPAMSAIQDDVPRLRRTFLYALGIQVSLALPASVGLALVADELVLVILGDKWSGSVPIMVALALGYGAYALTYPGGYLLAAMGKFSAQTALQWGTVAALALLLFAAFPSADAELIAWFRAGLGVPTIVMVTWLTIRYLPAVSVVDILRVNLRPALATIFMALLVAWIEAHSGMLSPWKQLAAKVAGGCVAYPVALTGLWFLAGRPDGAERWLLERVRSAL